MLLATSWDGNLYPGNGGQISQSALEAAVNRCGYRHWGIPQGLLRRVDVHILSLVPICGLVTSSKLEFGDLAKSQMTFGGHHQTPTYYG